MRGRDDMRESAATTVPRCLCPEVDVIPSQRRGTTFAPRSIAPWQDSPRPTSGHRVASGRGWEGSPQAQAHNSRNAESAKFRRACEAGEIRGLVSLGAALSRHGSGLGVEARRRRQSPNRDVVKYSRRTRRRVTDMAMRIAGGRAAAERTLERVPRRRATTYHPPMDDVALANAAKRALDEAQREGLSTS